MVIAARPFQPACTRRAVNPPDHTKMEGNPTGLDQIGSASRDFVNLVPVYWRQFGGNEMTDTTYHVHRAFGEILAAERARHDGAARAHRRLAQLHADLARDLQPDTARELDERIGDFTGPAVILMNGKVVASLG